MKKILLFLLLIIITLPLLSCNDQPREKTKVIENSYAFTDIYENLTLYMKI
jgi:hypothetical protein